MSEFIGIVVKEIKAKISQLEFPITLYVFIVDLVLLFNKKYADALDANKWIPKFISMAANDLYSVLYGDSLRSTVIAIVLFLLVLVNANNSFLNLLSKIPTSNKKNKVNGLHAANKILAFTVNLFSIYWVWLLFVEITTKKIEKNNLNTEPAIFWILLILNLIHMLMVILNWLYVVNAITSDDLNNKTP